VLKNIFDYLTKIVEWFLAFHFRQLYLWTKIVKRSKIYNMTTENKKNSDSHGDMRNTIVGIAAEVFAKFGFKKTTVDDIAQGIRKGKSSIYYYFNSKEDIFQAVVDREADELRKKIYKILDTPLSAKEKLRAYVKTRMLAVQVMANYYTLIRNNDLSNLELIEKLRAKYDTEEVTIIRGILKEGSDNGSLLIKDIELSAIAILTAMKGLEIPLFVTSAKVDNLENLLDDLLEMLFYGIVVRNQ
jgi:AcrR family transcriptional regulator